MKLRDDVTFEEDLEKNNFIITSDIKKMRKITGHSLPTLLGYNKFNSVGKEILNRLGCLEFVPIDPIYTLRGELSEQLAHDYIINMYKKYNINIETKTFPSRYKGSNGKWYGNDLFKNNERFGGVIDIGIVAPQEFRAVVEVKSKSFFNDKGFDVLDSIFPYNNAVNIPKEELWQGLHYAGLMNLNKLLMVYVFWSDEQVEMIRPILNQPKFDINEINAKEILKTLNFDYEQFTIIVERVDVDLVDVKKKQEQAYKILKDAFESRAISRVDLGVEDTMKILERIYGKLE